MARNKIPAAEVATWVRQMASSLATEPAQFNYEVHVIGTKIVGGPGGPGLVASATGGGVGNTVTGFYSGGPQIGAVEIRQAQTSAVSAQVEGWLAVLEQIAGELEQKHRGGPGRIRAALESLRGQAFPSVTLGLLTNALSAAIGL